MSDKQASAPTSSPYWPASGADGPRVTGEFAKARKTFAKLKERFESGGLSEPELKERLRDLMVQDEAGRWWVLGYETARWYVRDGDDWVESEPPRAAARPAAAEAAPETRSLMDTVWWPAVLIAAGIALSTTFTASMFAIFGSEAANCLRFTSPEYPLSQCLSDYMMDFDMGYGSGGLGYADVKFMFGAVAGLFTATVLKSVAPSVQWRQVIFTAACWAAVFGLVNYVVVGSF